MRKPVFRYIVLSLRIPAGWSGPSLSANRIIGYYRLRLCACAGWIWICACPKTPYRLTPTIYHCWTVFLTERIPHTCEKFGRICHAAWRIRPNFSQLPNVFLTYLWQTRSVSVLYIARKRICPLSKKPSKKCLFFMHGFLTNVFVTAYDIKHTINHLIQFWGNIFFLSCIPFNRVIDLLFIVLLFLTSNIIGYHKMK